ncbi:LysR family transcriptional regulator [Mariprofundus erugo]|uniref:LysR family transcriptional regulator n=1 Tax=Mariprofundus erugo TaxID=2528639 RepID=A0A5R9GVP3_9PROT|nr:LysR family transcriptional regulator [Mariprofundus erugo]TLS68303.1 LysR family transcriptional regulator [Mariprofundus erugo]TLS77157.1 LysR family transcriptional regulator [Mariprofundus erugo]
MTLDQLRALCAVVEQGGFHAASQALFRSQSAISIAIRNLEQELGLSLFDRNGYRPVLTPEGQVLYGKARSILARSEEMASIASHFARGEETEISLAMSAIAPVEQVLEVIRAVSLRAPATRMSLQVENMGGTLERLQEKAVNFAIAEQFVPVDGVEQVRLTSTEMVAVISPSFSLAHRYPRMTLADLESCVQVVVRDTSRRLPKQTAGVLAGAPQWLVNDFDMKKRMIMSGAGWGRMPRHRVNEELADGRLLALAGKGLDAMKIDMYLFRRLDEPMGPVGESLWQLLQQCKY